MPNKSRTDVQAPACFRKGVVFSGRPSVLGAPTYRRGTGYFRKLRGSTSESLRYVATATPVESRRRLSPCGPLPILPSSSGQVPPIGGCLCPGKRTRRFLAVWVHTGPDRGRRRPGVLILLPFVADLIHELPVTLDSIAIRVKVAINVTIKRDLAWIGLVAPLVIS